MTKELIFFEYVLLITVTLSEIHNLYKEWFRETYNNANNCPNKNELKEYLYKTNRTN
jgi:hypothetical protein